MIFYLLVMTLHTNSPAWPVRVPYGLRLEEIAPADSYRVAGSAWQAAGPVGGPNEAAVMVMAANQMLVDVQDAWEGRLYRIDLEGEARLTTANIPRIQTASDTLEARP